MDELYHTDEDAPVEGVEGEPAPYFCRFTFGQFFTLIVLLVITVCCTFYLGARYGNQYLRLDGPEAAVNTAATTKASAKAPVADRVPTDKELLERARESLRQSQNQALEQQVEQILSGNATGVATASVPDTEAPVATPPAEGIAAGAPPVADHVPPVTDTAQAPAEALAPVEQMTPPTEAARAATGPREDSQPALTQLQGANGLPYAVQVGSYRSIEEAKHLVQEWQTRGYPAYLMEAELPDSGRWYRIRVGNFATRHEAGTYLQGLQQRGVVNGLVVNNE